ncbi:hypothetical protein pb186bvf_013886 [Paramecium bursaria]
MISKIKYFSKKELILDNGNDNRRVLKFSYFSQMQNQKLIKRYFQKDCVCFFIL